MNEDGWGDHSFADGDHVFKQLRPYIIDLQIV